MGKMVNANQPLERLAMTGLIGKTITIDRERFVHNENSTSSLSYVLDKPTKQTKLKIISEAGETILEKDLGPQKAGEQTFVWDGGKTNGLATKGGNYIFRIDAEDVSGRTLPMQTKGQAKVVGVAFDGPEGVLLVGNPNSPQKITMRNIIRIDTSGEGPAIPGARTMASALQGQGVAGAGAPGAIEPSPQGQVQPVVAKQKPSGHFVEYQKPEAPASPDGMGADARRAAAAYEAAKGASGNNFATENSEKSLEKGFPSGLSSGDNN
jgi:flagellar basal-body rod modification protein FlgD